MSKVERTKTMLRLKPETHERAKEIAEECGRSLNAQIEYWISQGIKRNDWLDQQPESPIN